MIIDQALTVHLKSKLLRATNLKKLRETTLCRKVYTNLLPPDESNNLICEAIDKAAPYLVSRLGATETKICRKYLLKKKYSAKETYRIGTCAGVFPTTLRGLEDFTKEYTGSIEHVDLLGVSYPRGEGLLIAEFGAENLALTELKNIEPYYFSNPWSRRLIDKEVLVVHPFKDTILQQYEKRENLFGSEILPKFRSLEVVRAVQSIAGCKPNYGCWLDALSSMKNEISGKTFDVAIIGAGAYGLPLGAFIRSLGKVVLHLGGPTQVMFGIKGMRWDDRYVGRELYNSNWTRPLRHETPDNRDAVEGGCYW